MDVIRVIPFLVPIHMSPFCVCLLLWLPSRKVHPCYLIPTILTIKASYSVIIRSKPQSSTGILMERAYFSPTLWFSMQFHGTLNQPVSRSARGDIHSQSGCYFPAGGLVRLWRDRRGYSMTFWAILIALGIVPVLALAIELGRYFYGIAWVQKVANAAAVAASAEFNPQVIQDTGNLVPRVLVTQTGVAKLHAITY